MAKLISLRDQPMAINRADESCKDQEKPNNKGKSATTRREK
jgi:hypothetical protein